MLFWPGGAIYVGDSEDNFIGLGFTVGPSQRSIRTSRLAAYDLQDPLLYVNNDTIVPSIGVGLYGVLELGEHYLFGGISTPQVLGTEIMLITENGDSFVYDQLLHIYQYIGFYINTARSNRDYSFLEVSLWGKYVPNLPYHLDLNLRYQITDPMWLGVGISTTKSAHLEAGFNIPFAAKYSRIRVGYGFDFPFNSDYSTYTGGVHEVNLSWIIEK